MKQDTTQIFKAKVTKVERKNNQIFATLSTNGNYVLASGFRSMPKQGQFVEIEGFLSATGKISVRNHKTLLENNLDCLTNLLSSGYFVGIGKEKAKRLVNNFEGRLIDVIENNPYQLTQVEGISENLANKINETYKEIKDFSSAVMYFKQYDLTNKQIELLYEKYGFEAEEIVTSDPYTVVNEVKGLGFKKADQIAFKMGGTKNSLKRYKAAIMYVVNEHMNFKGDTLIYDDTMYERLGAILNKTIKSTSEIKNDVVEEVNENVANKLKIQFEYSSNEINAITNYIKNNINTLMASKQVPTFTELTKQLKTAIDKNAENIYDYISLNDLVKTASKQIIETMNFHINKNKEQAKIAKEENKKFIERNIELVKRAGNELRQDKQLLHFEDEEGKGFVVLKKYYDWEKYIAKRLTNLQGVNVKAPRAESINKVIAKYEKENNISLNNSQKQAVANSLSKNVSILTGGPGTGKTTTLKAVVKGLEANNKKYLLLSPTGKASRRLSEVTNREAMTIHKALKMLGGGKGFRYNENNKLPVDTVIVDEASMADIYITSSLLKALKDDAQIIFVGDPKQLNSIAPGNVLGDIINSNKLPVTKLETVYRQGEESDIVKNVNLVGQGHMPEHEKALDKNSEFVFNKAKGGKEILDQVIDLVTNVLPKTKGINAKDIVVQTAIHDGIVGTKNLNKILQQKLNPASAVKQEVKIGGRTFREGDKIIQLKNNDDKDVSNGEIGIIESIEPNKKILEVKFNGGRLVKYHKDYGQIKLAYAVTVHKMQGSQAKNVVVVVPEASPFIVKKKSLYVSMSRGEEFVGVVGNLQTVFRAVKLRDKERDTLLKGMLESLEKQNNLVLAK